MSDSDAATGDIGLSRKVGGVVIECKDADWYTSWADTILMLSLDLTSYFATEIGIERLHPAVLRSLAREVVPHSVPGEIFDEWFARLTSKIQQFIDSVAETLGEDAACQLDDWRRQTFLSSEQSGDLRFFEGILGELVDEWDSTRLSRELPLSGPEHAHLRVVIRDHVAHSTGVATEIDLTYERYRSDWDDAIETRHEDPYVGTIVWHAFTLRHTAAFSHLLTHLIPKADLEEMLRWMRSRARARGMPWTPPFPAISQATASDADQQDARAK